MLVIFFVYMDSVLILLTLLNFLSVSFSLRNLISSLTSIGMNSLFVRFHTVNPRATKHKFDFLFVLFFCLSILVISLRNVFSSFEICVFILWFFIISRFVLTSLHLKWIQCLRFFPFQFCCTSPLMLSHFSRSDCLITLGSLLCYGAFK